MTFPAVHHDESTAGSEALSQSLFSSGSSCLFHAASMQIGRVFLCGQSRCSIRPRAFAALIGCKKFGSC
jgi:hypothetical protein